uniref:Ovule protein n=1 Tax=Ascaris lumbricoides TaxID=6252 RepID=A0A0M3IJA3_ASCLU
MRPITKITTKLSIKIRSYEEKKEGKKRKGTYQRAIIDQRISCSSMEMSQTHRFVLRTIQENQQPHRSHSTLYFIINCNANLSLPLSPSLLRSLFLSFPSYTNHLSFSKLHSCFLCQQKLITHQM